MGLISDRWINGYNPDMISVVNIASKQELYTWGELLTPWSSKFKSNGRKGSRKRTRE